KEDVMWQIVNGVHVVFTKIYSSEVRSSGVIEVIHFQCQGGSIVDKPFQRRIEVDPFRSYSFPEAVGIGEGSVDPEGDIFLIVNRSVNIECGTELVEVAVAHGYLSPKIIDRGLGDQIDDPSWAPEVSGHALSNGSGTLEYLYIVDALHIGQDPGSAEIGVNADAILKNRDSPEPTGRHAFALVAVGGEGIHSGYVLGSFRNSKVALLSDQFLRNDGNALDLVVGCQR